MERAEQRVELTRLYRARFSGIESYRERVWSVLIHFFNRWIPEGSAVLDLGAGYCEFINRVQARRRYAMDLNPDVESRAAADVIVLQQDCSQAWELDPCSLDCVFTSNFLEHLPDKEAVRQVLANASQALKPGGRFIAMGPNIKYVPGAYWDFFDHYVALTELSLSEALKNAGYEIEECIPRFLPYTMSDGKQYPLWTLKIYLAIPFLWKLFGKQFLVVARKRG